MAQTISSAEPEKLFRYSDFGTQLDHELVSESYRLASRLQHFEAKCTEPGYRVSVGHLGDALRSYGSQSEYVDDWVRQVGGTFQMADWMQALDRSQAILLAGRTKVGKWIPFAPDLRRNPWRKIKSGTPGGFLLDAGLGFLAHPEDWNLRGAEIAVTDAGITTAIGMTGVGTAVLLGNAAVQLAGSTLIWSHTEVAQTISVDPMQDRLLEESDRRAQEALEKIDLGRITRDVATTIVDLGNARAQAVYRTQLEMWRQPSIGNLLRLGLLTYPQPGISEATTVLLDPKAAEVTMRNVRSLGSGIADFGVGLIEAPIEVFRHGVTAEYAIISGLIDRVRRASTETRDMIASPAY